MASKGEPVVICGTVRLHAPPTSRFNRAEVVDDRIVIDTEDGMVDVCKLLRTKHMGQAVRLTVEPARRRQHG